jgi:hypothetical protein
MTAPRPLCISCSAEIPPRTGSGRNHVRCEPCRSGKANEGKVVTKPLVKPVPARAVVVERAPIAIPLAESVDHPAHYRPGTYEAINVIEAWGLGFHLGNAVKYIARAGLKGARVEDLKKARWYLDREITRAEVAT